MMNYKLMHCYSRKSKLLALIDIDAISEITWHENGMYIYWRRTVMEYDEITTERAGCIVCDWTKVESISDDVLEYLRKHGTRIILEDTAIYDASEFLYTSQELIKDRESELTREDIEEGIRCSNL